MNSKISPSVSLTLEKILQASPEVAYCCSSLSLQRIKNNIIKIDRRSYEIQLFCFYTVTERELYFQEYAKKRGLSLCILERGIDPNLLVYSLVTNDTYIILTLRTI